MEMLITYVLILLIFITWHYGIKNAIRRIFKNFLYIATKKFATNVRNKDEKKMIYLCYNSTCKFIDSFTLREAIKIVDCIYMNIKNNNVETQHPIQNSELEKYLKLTVAVTFGCLKACTFIGSIHFLFYMLYPTMGSKEERIAKRESMVKKYTDTVPQKDIAQTNPMEVFKSFAAANATSPC